MKRRRSSPPPVNANPAEISEEDQLLLRLRDEEALSWKEIAARFQTEFGKTYQIPALQMRIKRLRARLRVWTQTDVSALKMAHEYWERNKFEIISAKVRFGIDTSRGTIAYSCRWWTLVRQRSGPQGSAPESGRSSPI